MLDTADSMHLGALPPQGLSSGPSTNTGKQSSDNELDAQPGVHFFAIEPSVHQEYVLEHVLHRVGRGEKMASVPYPEKATEVLFAGSQRALLDYQRFSGKFTESGKDCRKLTPAGQRPINWTDAAAIELARRSLSSEKYLVLMQPIGRPVQAEDLTGLLLLQEAAKAKNAHVLVLMSIPRLEGIDELMAVCAEGFTIRPAEPDPGAMVAWSVANREADYRLALGIGRRLVQVKVEKGHLGFHEMQFIAADMQTRFLAKCLAAGLTQVEAASAAGLTKSTVCRHVKNLPRIRPAEIGAGWWEAYQPNFQFGDEMLERLRTLSSTVGKAIRTSGT